MLIATSVVELLAPFVNSEDGRYAIGRQWIKGGWRMATDGQVAVRINSGEADLIHVDDTGHQLRFPDMPSLFESHREKFEAVDTFTPLFVKPCDTCKNTGRIIQHCTECFMGEAECDKCGHQHKCDNCDGTGEEQVPCTSCENLVVSNKFEIDVMYLYWIQKLPGARIRHLPKNEISLFTFEFDGMPGQGMVIHRRRE